MGVDEKVVEQKIQSGEELTAEETKFVMSYPNPEEGGSVVVSPDPEEDDAFDDMEEEDNSKQDEDITSEEEEDAASGEKQDAKETPDPKEKKEKAPEDSEAGSEKKEKKQDEAEGKQEAKSKPESLADKLEKELQKPEGQEDLSEFSDREKGLYYELRNERRKRQQAQEELDVIKFNNIKKENEAKQAQDTEKIEGEIKEAAERLNELLEGGDSEMLTKAEAKEMLDLYKKISSAKSTDPGSQAESIAASRKSFIRMAEMNARDIIENRRLKGSEMPDYEEVLKHGPDIIDTNEQYKKQLLEAYEKGKNPALLAYDLIRNDDKFKTLYGKEEQAKGKKGNSEDEDEGKKTLKKINNNLKKPKTSGAHGGGADTFEDNKGNKYSASQLLAMSTSDFRKVPKAVRDKFLKNF